MEHFVYKTRVSRCSTGNIRLVILVLHVFTYSRLLFGYVLICLASILLCAHKDLPCCTFARPGIVLDGWKSRENERRDKREKRRSKLLVRAQEVTRSLLSFLSDNYSQRQNSSSPQYEIPLMDTKSLSLYFSSNTAALTNDST